MRLAGMERPKSRVLGEKPGPKRGTAWRPRSDVNPPKRREEQAGRAGRKSRRYDLPRTIALTSVIPERRTINASSTTKVTEQYSQQIERNSIAQSVQSKVTPQPYLSSHNRSWHHPRMRTREPEALSIIIYLEA
ncbi:hypothetical protein KM043_017249 [Ampulex compressa]|nr:hypothetical protein KM043_017249 [Ampulex compressa]